jgi:NAD(P)-dependent dehydrogenase (short-subunit alcohol dehydrogenase family)
MIGRTWAAETKTSRLRVNLFNPGPIRTRMRESAFPGEDPATLKTPDQAAEKIVELCLPSFSESGKLYDFPSGKLLSFRGPA